MDETEQVQCRSCLKQLCYEYERVNLFSDYKTIEEKPVEFKRICELFSKYTFLKVEKIDELTPYICFDCYDQLTNFHQFRRTCAASYLELLKQKYSIKTCYVPIERGKSNTVVKKEIIEEEAEEDGYGDPTESFGFDDDGFGFEAECKTEELEDELLLECDKPSEINITKKPPPSKKIKRVRKVNKDPTNEEIDPNAQKFKCEQCNKVFLLEYRYKGHLRVHQGLKPYECEQCKKQYAKYIGLEHHIAKKHTFSELPKYICGIDDCGKSYLAKKTLYNHMCVVHLKNVQPVKKEGKVVCEVCGQVFCSKYALSKHLDKHEDGGKKEKCPYCSKMLSPTSIAAHIRYNHEYGKKHICPICGAAKSKRSELLEHINYHTRETKYPCDICGKVFYKKSKVKIHVAVVHQGLKNHICKYCSKAFGSAQTLRDHLMLHTGEKRFICKICGRGYIQRHPYKLHVRSHARIDEPIQVMPIAKIDQPTYIYQ